MLLMPGTHPKHITVRHHQALRFQSFMTGEFFDLLSAHSILAASVGNGGQLDDPACRQFFTEGLHAGRKENLLHAAFLVRTNQLLKKVPPEHNQFYLSGLLIGSELKEVPPQTPACLVAGPLHTPLYTLACRVLGIHVAAVIDAEEALIHGQQAVISNLQR